MFPSFSIIIPLYNSQDSIEASIESVLNQDLKIDYEIIVIDDRSSDKSYEIVKQIKSNYKDKIQLLQNPSNMGPGYSRNKGIESASKEWIIFLDSDDLLKKNAFRDINKVIQQSSKADLISYNFEYFDGSGNRKDIHSLSKSKTMLLQDYISLFMDGSAIFTAFKKEFLIKNKTQFTQFFHEDVYFMFEAYYFADKIEIINEKLYLKNNRENSIVNTISKKHIDGFLNAYEKIYEIIKDKPQYIKAYTVGIIGVCAIKVRDIFHYAPSNDKTELYEYLHIKITPFLRLIQPTQSFDIQTRYYKIFDAFIHQFKDIGTNKFENLLKDLLNKSWSCYDLHHSAFLGSDEIRACCKRFFVDGEKKGDVVLCTLENEYDPQNIYEKILNSKKDLFHRINSGVAEECNGCPHLVFKNWGEINSLEFEKISFEYHSICNMRCIYCSQKYYGGKKPIYDIKGFIDFAIKQNAFKSTKSIVWGGGEPTIEKSFDDIITSIASKIDLKQMVITNALKYSSTLQKLIDNNQAMITTSIDSGFEENFHKIRGAKGISKVFSHLNLYASHSPENITIKYILMQNNSSKEELENFIHLILENNLKDCNFHISCNFNEEKIQQSLIESCIVLYALLKNIGAKVVFFDELLRERIFIDSPTQLEYTIQSLEKYGFGSILENPAKYKKVCIWGSIQAKLLLSKSIFFQKIPSIEIIDSNPEAIGKNVMGKIVKDPKEFLKDDSFITIAAVQGTPRIYREFLKMGFEENRLIQGVIL